MDQLAVKTEKVKVLTVKLEHDEKQINKLLSEKAVIKNCIAYVNALLSDIIETHDSLITITVKKHLAEKLRQPSKKDTPKPADRTVNPTVKPKSENETNVNVASGSKGKGKLNDERIIDDSEEEEPDEHELKRWKAREAQMNEHNRIVREFEEKEKVKREAQVTMESRKLLFPLWTLERIMSDTEDIPSQYWFAKLYSASF
ncbi:unnamed protein product [Lactuca saligna]|uniref:Uncharacterized protein n=1 Tax=Lactuca saligna TaxID=75948 RepID=A0AA36A570_LACSI|nr:unnamed protein product [Lactuca saligna]